MAEELGWIGIFLFFTGIIFLIFRVLRAGKLSNDQFGTHMCTGFAAVFFIQTVLNAGVNLNLLPTTGQTLPFVSYGGSSLLTLMFSLGLIESIVVRRRVLKFDW
jgi:cell division protein FtsW (lipid II flippase)